MENLADQRWLVYHPSSGPSKSAGRSRVQPTTRESEPGTAVTPHRRQGRQTWADGIRAQGKHETSTWDAQR